MVPAGKPAVGRARATAVGLAQTPTEDADHRAEQRHQRAGQRQVDHQVAPQAVRANATQRVQPVQPGADQVPAALQGAGIAHHFTGMAGDVQQGTLAIVELDPL
ncbi:hypothetical protein D3C85_1000760 [compost metagenome]